MLCYHICFSPTGGTQRVLDALGSSCREPAIPIDLTDPGADFSRFSFGEEDLCLVAVPSYGGRVPGAAAVRLRHFQGNGATAVLIAVYGNRAYEDTLLELRDILTEWGFRCAAAVAAVAEHSIFRQFAAGRPDEEDIFQLRDFSSKIRGALAAGAPSPSLPLPGNHPYREYKGVPFVPKATGDCVECGLCARSCPVQAIQPSPPFASDSAQCIACMRCIAICPRQARTLNRALLFAASQKLKGACAQRKPNQLFL